MRKILFLFVLLASSILYSQTKIDGILSANEYTGKVISQYDGTHFWVIHNNKYTFIDNKGNVIYKDLGMKNTFQPGNNIAKIKNSVFVDYNKTAFLSRFVSIVNKKPLSDFSYSEIIPYNNDTYFAVKKEGKTTKYLYLDKDLKVIYTTTPDLIIKKLNLPTSRRYTYTSNSKYENSFGYFNDGVAKFYNPSTRKFGVINEKGVIVVPTKYKKVSDFSEGLAFFKNDDNLYGYLNNKGKIVIPAKYSKQPYAFASGLAKVVSKEGFFGFIDKNDQLIVNPKYRYATNFYKDHALVKAEWNTPILLINTSGKILKQFDKELKVAFQEKADAFRALGLNVESQTHVNPTLKQLVDFKKGIFQDKFNKSGLLDIDGNIILDFKYKSLKDYNNGLVLAIFNDQNKKEKQGLINEKGELVVEVGLSQF